MGKSLVNVISIFSGGFSIGTSLYGSLTGKKSLFDRKIETWSSTNPVETRRGALKLSWICI